MPIHWGTSLNRLLAQLNWYDHSGEIMRASTIGKTHPTIDLGWLAAVPVSHQVNFVPSTTPAAQLLCSLSENQMMLLDAASLHLIANDGERAGDEVGIWLEWDPIPHTTELEGMVICAAGVTFSGANEWAYGPDEAPRAVASPLVLYGPGEIDIRLNRTKGNGTGSMAVVGRMMGRVYTLPGSGSRIAAAGGPRFPV